MRTINRAPKTNYLDTTLKNLEQGGLFKSRIPFSFQIFDSGSEDLTYLKGIEGRYPVVRTKSRLSLLGNAARALSQGSQQDCDFVIFLEDDIEVCSRWLESIDGWLSHYCSEAMRIAVFYTPYPDVLRCFKEKRPVWKYPSRAFYGSQCFALRRDDAESLSRYLSSVECKGTDLIIKDWLNLTYPTNPFFYASCPSFVQHIGIDSSLGERKAHQCSSYQGQNWKFHPEYYIHHL